MSTETKHPRVPVDAPGPRRGLQIGEAAWDPEGFWGRRQETNAAHTFEHCASWMERLGWLENFDRVARGESTVERAGWEFADSEVYKLLEGLAWELGRRANPRLQALYDSLVARIGAAQAPDGYQGTAFGHPGLPPRYSNMSEGHELYNMGHLIQAAVARLRTYGDDALVQVARRAADHVCREFGEGARATLCGHPEIEVALAEFARATGEERYREQARIFLERRGRGTLPVRVLLSAEYFQDDTPIREADVLRGHAVRALYLSAGAVDVAVDTGDDDLLGALRRQWDRTVARRTFVTGGMGSRHQDEGFGEDWELPPDRAYCETCAGIASVMFSWRLLLATGEAKYADLIERTLHNVVATGPSEDGRAFFYANPLHVRVAGHEYAGEGVNMRAEGGVRAPWFDVSCCPTNVSRTFASTQAYAAFVDADALTLSLYGAGRIAADLGGETFEVRVDTAYPVEGRVEVTVERAPAREVALRLRVPGWAADARGTSPAGEVALAPGWWEVTRAFAPGDRVVLDLDLSPRLAWPDSRIDAQRGTVAVTRGPLVLCVESTDLPDGVAFEDVLLDAAAPLRAHGDGAIAAGLAPASAPDDAGVLPFTAEAPAAAELRAFELPLVPYHRWGARGPAQMRVMIPLAPTAPGT
ncbi:glycoside hydrolase family 127 protein [Demequina pelophila]|uniref:glycoside hydrolase family 127 protein n=1 Tax=Demequina pelophila TaxID=1638984 RepID=UPI000782D784|nr:beta-L-arabinofuranosidase domain-containing protein [Demequina pelophila]